jgi:hypothetical protein
VVSRTALRTLASEGMVRGVGLLIFFLLRLAVGIADSEIADAT